MAEYIEREELERILETKYERLAGLRPDFYAGFMAATKIVREETRNADVAPVIHAKWENVTVERARSVCGENTKIQYKRCGNCKKPMGLSGDQYCGNCGARMDLKEGENGGAVD